MFSKNPTVVLHYMLKYPPSIARCYTWLWWILPGYFIWVDKIEHQASSMDQSRSTACKAAHYGHPISDGIFSLVPKGRHDQHICLYMADPPHRVLPSAWPRRGGKMGQWRGERTRGGGQKRPAGEQSCLWAAAEGTERDGLTEKETRGIICFPVFEHKGKVFK